MKFKTSMKEMKKESGHLISTGYCTLQNLLYYEQPIAYSAGQYSWNCDYYIFDGVTIATGYRTPKGIKVDYETIIKYETEAKKIQDDETLSYNEKKEAVKRLLESFINEVIMWRCKK